jgi:hypothetical protein
MKTVVVDSHNEILPLWFEEYLKVRHPLVVVRIDQHHDMNQGCPSLPATEGRQIFDYLAKIMPHIYEYAKRKLNEGNFTCPAFHYGIVGALYHFDPRDNEIDAYGRVSKGIISDAPKTTMTASFIAGKRLNQIIWDKASTKLRLQGGKVIPVPQNISIDSFKKDIDGCHFPVAIGFDLDGLYGMNDKGATEVVVEKRLERVKDVLSYISSPILACIARSQTPRAYVPPEIVDHLQQTVLQLFERKSLELNRI